MDIIWAPSKRAAAEYTSNGRLCNGSVKLLVLLTKSEKLNRKESRDALADAQAQLGEMTTDEADVGVTLLSALDKTGVGDAALVLHGWTHPETSR